MLISPEVLRTHLDYTAWASARLVEAASQLTPEELTRDFGTADKTVLGTLVHCFAADRIWMKRVSGERPAPFIDAERDMHLSVLQTEWPPLALRWNAWASALTPESAQAVIKWTDLKGNSFEMPAWQIALHVVNHGTHHRGQVSGFIRALGKVPPPNDLARYYRELTKK